MTADHRGFPGYGFTRTPDGEVVEDPAEIESMRLIVNMAGQGHSLRHIAACLNSTCVPTRRGNRWAAQSVQNALNSRAAQSLVKRVGGS